MTLGRNGPMLVSRSIQPRCDRQCVQAPKVDQGRSESHLQGRGRGSVISCSSGDQEEAHKSASEANFDPRQTRYLIAYWLDLQTIEMRKRSRSAPFGT